MTGQIKSHSPGRLKVLFVTSWYPTVEQPVAGVFVREHAKAVQLYDDVVLVHLAGPRADIRKLWDLHEDKDQEICEGVPTLRLWYRPIPTARVSLVVYELAMIGVIRALSKRGFRPDIIHANVYDSAAAVLAASKLYRIPVVVTEHSTAFPRRLLKPRHVLVARLAYRSASMVMPVSCHLERSIRSYGIQARFTVIPNVVNLDLFRPRKDGSGRTDLKRLLFVGLLDASHKKGLPFLFEALAQLKLRRSDWHLDLVGDGPARPGYEQTVAELGLQDKVTFHGLRSKADVAQFMREADVFVLPSIFETFGCVLVEAMACGLPIVSTETGGIPEIVDSESGILVPPADIDALARGLNQMMDSLDLYDRQGIARKALRFSPEVVGKAIDNVYRQVLGVGFDSSGERQRDGAADRPSVGATAGVN